MHALEDVKGTGTLKLRHLLPLGAFVASQECRRVAARSSPLPDGAWGETLALWFASHRYVRARRTPLRALLPPEKGCWRTTRRALRTRRVRELKSSGGVVYSLYRSTLPEASGRVGEVHGGRVLGWRPRAPLGGGCIGLRSESASTHAQLAGATWADLQGNLRGCTTPRTSVRSAWSAVFPGNQKIGGTLKFVRFRQNAQNDS